MDVSTFGLGPPQLLALSAGTLVSIGLTQIIKKATNSAQYAWTVRLTAFLIGGFATYTLWPPVGLGFAWGALWAGLIVGLWTPTAFKAFKVFARNRGWEWAAHL